MSNVRLGTNTNRAPFVAAVFSALSLAPIVPHIVEDAAHGVFADLGLELSTAAWALGALLAAQMVFALGSLRERRWGYVGIVLLAAGWVLAAVTDHWQAFTPRDFRAGMSSRAAVWGLVGCQVVAAIAAITALRGTRRTSFSGTGSFSS